MNSIIFVLKRGTQYLLPGDAEKWTDDWLAAREFTDEQEANEIAARLGARVVAID
ncbi:hypothetical protein PQR46_18730 [Paraburkholderia sediminicola]|uniref:hypothetical protein n=1 Tax=Paraburkholderia sediminicola TaxID=458836 RepID=UPI0038B8EFCD